MTEYESYLYRQKQAYKDKFDPSKLNPAFIGAYNSGERVYVDFGFEVKGGTIGVTTGWVPVFLLMLTRRSIGSFYTIGENDKIISKAEYQRRKLELKAQGY